MLNAQENELLTHVGPGTPLGDLLRRYWTPACLSVELPEPNSACRVRLFGEDLVAYRDREGVAGLIEAHCPHRGASLYFARIEEGGLRCVYHGWKFDRDGRCVEMPSERRSFAAQIRATTYPTHESGGVVWAYLGPAETITPFRDFGTESLAPDQVFVTKEPIACNFIQSLDGDLDSAHISYLHQFDAIDAIPDDGTDKPGFPSNFQSMRFWRHDRAPALEIDDQWYGFRYAGLRRTPNGYVDARISVFVMPFIAMIASVPYSTRQLIIVPRDDTTTWRYTLITQRLPNPYGFGGPPFYEVDGYPYAKMPAETGVIARDYTAENDYQFDRRAQDGVSFSGVPDFRSQDLMVTESMGPIYDHTREHLGTTDLALTRMRELLLSAARTVAEGGTPPAVGSDLPYRSIRAAEKVLADDEDWRVVGTDEDPIVQETLLG